MLEGIICFSVRRSPWTLPVITWMRTICSLRCFDQQMILIRFTIFAFKMFCGDVMGKELQKVESRSREFIRIMLKVIIR